jgi:hypothetical protein
MGALKVPRRPADSLKVVHLQPHSEELVLRVKAIYVANGVSDRPLIESIILASFTDDIQTLRPAKGSELI